MVRRVKETEGCCATVCWVTVVLMQTNRVALLCVSGFNYRLWKCVCVLGVRGGKHRLRGES